MNSCPMFTFTERDAPRTPTPLKSHYLWKPDLADINEDYDHDYENGTLPKLPGSMLKGTFSKAYAVISKLAHKIGWDELLKCRSSAFVMEEEYRQLKAQEEENNRKKKEKVDESEEEKVEKTKRSNSLIARPKEAAQESETVLL